MSDEQAVLNGQEVQKFLQNPVVMSVFTELDRRYYEAWKAATTPGDREALWNQARALDDISAQLLAVVQAGELANHNAERANRPVI